jgi:hypothetical protein
LRDFDDVGAYLQQMTSAFTAPASSASLCSNNKIEDPEFISIPAQHVGWGCSQAKGLVVSNLTRFNGSIRSDSK